MTPRDVALARVSALFKREIRAPGTWALVALFSMLALWSTWSGTGGPSVGRDLSIDLGPITITSWLTGSSLIMTFLIPLWIIERIPQDQRGQWFDPFFAAGWSRDGYVLSLFFVIVGFGYAVFLDSILLAWILSFILHAPMPPNTLGIALASGPTFLATGAGGLFLATLLRDKGAAIAVGLAALTLPIAIMAFLVLQLGRDPSELFQRLITLHLPPLRLDLSPVWLLYKLAYAAVTLWLSLLLSSVWIGRRP